MVKIMKEKVNIIYSMSRYKIIEYNHKKYLLDAEQNMFAYLLPMLNWIIKRKLIEISEHDLEDIKNNDYKGKKGISKGLGVTLGGISSILATIMRPIMDLMDVEVSLMGNLIIFAVIVTIVIVARYYLRQKRYINLKQYSNTLECRVTSSFKQKFKATFNYLFFLLFSILGLAMMFTGLNNMIIYLLCLLMMFMVTMETQLSYNQYEAIVIT